MTAIKRMWDDLDKWYQHDIDSDQQQIKRFISKHLNKILEELKGYDDYADEEICKMIEEIKKEGE